MNEQSAVLDREVELVKQLDEALSRFAGVTNEMNAIITAFEGALSVVWEDFTEASKASIRERLAARKDVPIVDPKRIFRELEAAFATLENGRQIQLLEELRSGDIERLWRAPGPLSGGPVYDQG